MVKQTLIRQQLDKKISSLSIALGVINPPTGWIKAVREALGMSLEQLGNKLLITRQSVAEMEEREKTGSITLNTLQEAAKALDMELVYGFVPKDGSLEALIDRKAKELATEIVMRTSNTMKLEDQENTPSRIKKAIEERAEAIKRETPKKLWD
mgnify:CR=1 FL=1